MQKAESEDTSSKAIPAALRFVLLVNGQNLYRWQAEALRKLLDSGNASLELIVVNGAAEKAFAPKLSGLKRYFANPQLLWNLYNRIAVNRRCRALDEVDYASITAAPAITVTPHSIGKFSEGIDQSAIDAIAAVKPDFILRFGFGILKGAILDAAPLGIWSFHHGNPAEFRGLPPAFWEISQNCPTTGVILQRLGTKLDDGHILHQGWFETSRHSFLRTLDTIYMGAAHFAARVCAEVIASGKLPDVPKESPGPVYRAPANADMLRFFARLARNRLANLIRYKLRRQQWSVAVVPAPVRTVAGLDGAAAQSAALTQAHWMSEQTGRFFADPFAVPRKHDDQQLTLVFEDFDWGKDVGHIASANYSEGEGFSQPRPLIADGSHFSYPFLLEDNGKLLCIPENSATGRTDLHQLSTADLVPAIRQGTLSDRPLVDPTIIRQDGRFWLFAGLATATHNTELHLYYADKLEGDWTPHPLNPVKTDVRSARPGGSIIRHEGALYRPAQDCSVNYGGRITLCRIDRLDTEGYAETIVGSCDPVPGHRYSGGLHTLADAGNHTLIDGCRYQWFFDR